MVWACPCVRTCVRGSHFAYGQEQLEIGSWNLICGIRMKNKRTRIFIFSVGLFVSELCPFFDVFLYFAIISLWKLVNKISGEPLEQGSWYLAHRLCPGVDDLINFWQNSINLLMNYLPLPTLGCRIVKQSCQQTIWRTAWARIMASIISLGAWCRWAG